MKNIIVFTVIALAIILSSCKKEDNTAPERIALNGVTSLKNNRSTSDLKQLNWMVKHVSEFRSVGFSRGFNHNPKGHPFAQRDTINGRLFFFGDDAIGGIHANEDGLGYFLANAKNVVFKVTFDSEGNIWGDWSESEDKFMSTPGATMIDDTVAYIPNAVIEKTRREVLEALKAGDNQRCYELFDKAIVFIPITGAEYRELEARGEN